MAQYILTEKLLKEIVIYLSRRPYVEVQGFILALQQLSEFKPENKKEKKDGN